MHKLFECENGKVHVIGNGHVRELLDPWRLPDWAWRKAKEDYDLGDDPELADGMYFTYRGEVYSLEDFTKIGGMWHRHVQDWEKDWDGVLSDSFFSGILVRYAEIPDSYGDYGVQVAWYCS